MMDNLTMMRKRLLWQGGIEQENRMIKGKYLSLKKALLYSYQACTVSIVQPHSLCLLFGEDGYEFPDYRALINPDKVKQDYDDKILSIPFVDNQEYFVPGDIFEWRKTNTKWIIYLEEVTEDAYFRGEIRRCRYKINFKDEEGNWCSTWAAIRGPTETQIESIQKNQERLDRPNLSLNILLPQNEKTLYAFDRYKEFIFAGRGWQIQAPDSISMRGVIEVNAEEDYINKDTDDTEQEMKDGLVIEPEDPTPDSGITGETFIKPRIKEKYSVEEPGGTWSVVEENYPVRICPSADGTSITLVWNKATSGYFTLRWTNGSTVLDKAIVVESLF